MKMMLAVRKRTHQTLKRIKWIQALSMQKNCEDSGSDDDSSSEEEKPQPTKPCKDSGSDEDSSSEEEEPQPKKPKLASNDAVKDQKPPMIPKPGSEDSESDGDDSGSENGDSSSDDEKKPTAVKQETTEK